ncbi:hypothetical protein ACHAPG_010784 [Botrytis cinerea]
MWKETPLNFVHGTFVEEDGIDEEFVDAGLGCNNPIQQLIAEAKSEFDPTRPVACILSIGAGITKALGFTRLKSLVEKVAPMSFVNVLMGMAISTEKEAAEMEKKYKDIPGVYHRLNIGRDVGDTGLEEWKELGQVNSHTKAYLRKDGISRQIDGMVTALAQETRPKIRVHQLDLAYMQLAGVLEQHSLHYTTVGKQCRKAWIDGTAKTSVEQSFSRTADSIIGKSLKKVNIASFPTLARDKIETWKEPWLLVFDNFDEPTDYYITKYLPQTDFGLGIITDRRSGANDLGYPILIDLLEEEAINLLFHQTNKERAYANIKYARKICCHLSCLVLAVDQAEAYIKSTGINLGLFIEHFNKQQENVMAWSPPPLKRYKRLDPAFPDQEIALTISTTWELSYNRISGSKEIVEAERHFILIGAFFDSNRIKENIFQQFFERTS